MKKQSTDVSKFTCTCYGMSFDIVKQYHAWVCPESPKQIDNDQYYSNKRFPRQGFRPVLLVADVCFQDLGQSSIPKALSCA